MQTANALPLPAPPAPYKGAVTQADADTKVSARDRAASDTAAADDRDDPIDDKRDAAKDASFAQALAQVFMTPLPTPPAAAMAQTSIKPGAASPLSAADAAMAAAPQPSLMDPALMAAAQSQQAGADIGLNAAAQGVATSAQTAASPPTSSAQAAMLQAMGDAASNPATRVIGTVPGAPASASAKNSAAPEPVAQPAQIQAAQAQAAQADPSVQMQPASMTLVSNKAAELAATNAPTHGLISPQAASQAAGHGVVDPAKPGETASATVTPQVQPGQIAAMANASTGQNGGQSSGEDADSAASGNAEAEQVQSAAVEGSADTDLFGAPLLAEAKPAQAALSQASTAPRSTAATAPHLAAEISRKFEGRSAQFDVSLTPEGLGKVDVKITINARGEVSAAMKFDTPQAAAELKGRASELQKALEQSGFNLSSDGITFSDGQGQNFGAPQQQAGQQDWQETARRNAQSRSFQDTNDLADATALKAAEAASAYNRRSSTGVDVRI